MAEKPFGGGGTGDKDDSRFPSGGGFFRGESSSAHERMASEPNPVMLDVTNMEGIIHQYAIEAYRYVLRAFRVRADTISWEQEVSLTDLRKELRLTPDEHLSIFRSVIADETVQYMRALRESRELQPATLATSQLGHDQNPSTSGSGGPFSSFQPQPTYIANQLSTSARTFVGADRNYPSSGVGRGQFGSHVSSGGRVDEPAQGAPNAVGRRVRTRYPVDQTFYEAMITDFNPREGIHTLTYDLPSGPAVVDSVNLNQISAENIQWLSNDGGTSYHGGYRAPSPAMIPMNQAPGTHERSGRPPGCRDQSRNDRPPLPPPRGLSIRPGEIRILHTDSLIREVERVFNDSNSTPQDRAFARNKLREHEQSLTYAIARVREIETDDDDTDEGTDEEARHDLPLPPRQDLRIGPDENQIRTDSVLREAERVLNDRNSTAEERVNASGQVQLLLTDSQLTDTETENAINMLQELNRKASDENAGKGADGEANTREA